MSGSEKAEERWKGLAIAAQSGDKDAYRELLKGLDELLSAYCARSLGTLGVVEDCVQDILLTIHKNLHTFDPNRAFLPWLYAIARNRVIDYLRKYKRRKTLDEQILVQSELKGVTSSVGNEDAQRRFSEILASLSPVYQEAIVLTKFKGLTLGEAAEVANVGESAMKVRVHRAHKKIVAELVGGTSAIDF
jgi:RNA polymerase sigma-70 factor (ECF subfamily)